MTKKDEMIAYWRKSADADLVIKFSFFKRCTKEFTEDYFKRIKEFYQWLKVKIQLDES